MSLYVRVHNSFWNHRKTLRLRAKIGDAAFWVPPRLWSYAADNQPNGDFSDYSAEEVAMLIGYQGNATSMLEAMQQASFLDGMRIHDWDEHNGYHSKFSERGKKGAAARWNQKRDDKKRKDKKGKELSIASSMLQASDDAPLRPLNGRGRCTSEEAADYCKSIGLPASDGEAMFLHWEEKGWAKVKDWKLTIQKWKSFGYLPSQKAFKPKFAIANPGEAERNSKLDRRMEEARQRVAAMKRTGTDD